MEDFIKYPKIKIIGDEENKDLLSNPEDFIIIEEKIDGGNFRFMIYNDNLIFGTRTQQITSDEGKESNVNKNFKRCLMYIKDKIINNINKNKYNHYIFFGECCVKHSMGYDWEKIPPFIGFDVYSMKEKKFLDYTDVKKIYNSLKIEVVPLIEIIQASKLKKYTDEDIPITKYPPKLNPKLQAEGIVFKNYRTQIFAKYVRSQFKEENKLAFGSSKKYANDDSERVAFEYCTNARIEKCIFKLIDDGNKLSVKLMELLPNAVYADIVEEHYKDVMFSRMTVNFHTIKKIVSTRCFKVLSQVIVNNALNV